MANDIIGSIVCTPANPLPGESVLIEVHAPAGQTFSAETARLITIDGVPATRRYVQFMRPGKHTILARAVGSHGVESDSATVDVQVAPSAVPHVHRPAVHHPAAAHPAATAAAPHSAATVAAPTPAAPAAPHLAAAVVAPDAWPSIGVPIMQMAHLPQQPHQVGFAIGQTSTLELHPGNAHLRSRTLVRLPRAVLPAAGATPTYHWDFGDGGGIATMSPTVGHDYRKSLDLLSEYQHFDVTVTSGTRKVTRTLTICNLYAVLKRRYGVLHPTAEPSGFARRISHGYTATMVVTNPEPKPIKLVQRRLVPIHENSAHLTAPLAVEPVHAAITVPAKGMVAIHVTVTDAQVPHDCVGFSAYYAGQGADGHPVRVNGHFDIDPRERPHHATLLHLNPHEIDVLNKAMKATAHPAQHGVTLSQLREHGGPEVAAFEAARPTLNNIAHVAALTAALPAPERAHAVSAHPIATHQLTASNIDVAKHLPAGIPHPTHAGAPAHRPAPTHGPAHGGVPGGPPPPPAPLPGSAPPPQVGAECDPDNLPDILPQGFACQATPETRTVITKGRFMNARKGDAVLAPGGNGLIGGLLTQVAVPQRYSHSGIMTTNYDQVTHCTASSDRMQDYPVGSIPTDGPEPVDGFRVDVVRYGWPGTITQTVENAVNGEQLNDPEGGKPYNIQAFDGSADAATIAGSWQIIPPMVVKPDPMLETEQLRLQLHKVADDAAAHTGKFHYRFFCYTDPSIGKTTVAPADAGWAKGTSPGVCSAFVWLMMKRNGMHLQGPGDTVLPGDLSPAEIEAGAKIGPATPDGLYLYSGAERSHAGQWLHDQIYNKAYDTISQKAGILGGVLEFFTKLADHVSNETCNAFAADHIQTDDDNEDWKNALDSNAVSPDNIMLWNGPAAPTPGPYGYSEPLVYREPRYDTVTIYKWRQVQLTGTLQGRVIYRDQPQAHAMVQLYDGKSAGTDANGHYVLQNVPYGSYLAKAQLVLQDRSFLSASPNVTINALNTTLDIKLADPPDLFRTVKIEGKIHTHYTYHIILKTEDKSGDLPFYVERNVGPYHTHEEYSVTNTVKDAHATLHVVLDWQLDKSVTGSFTFNLHDKTATNNFHIAKDGTGTWWATCSADNDDARVDFKISNTLKQG